MNRTFRVAALLLLVATIVVAYEVASRMADARRKEKVNEEALEEIRRLLICVTRHERRGGLPLVSTEVLNSTRADLGPLRGKFVHIADQEQIYWENFGLWLPRVTGVAVAYDVVDPWSPFPAPYRLLNVGNASKELGSWAVASRGPNGRFDLSREDFYTLPAQDLRKRLSMVDDAVAFERETDQMAGVSMAEVARPFVANAKR